MPVFRFAPSPNGLLHLGHAYSALLNARMADRAGGRLLLRLEDIDPVRCRPEYEAAILEDLDWLGVRFEEPPIRQSANLAAHGAAIDRLRTRNLLYPCFCSRSDIARAVSARRSWPADPDGAPLYPGTCRSMPKEERARRVTSGEPHALRLDMRAAMAAISRPPSFRAIPADLAGEAVEPVDPAAWGDVVLARKEIPTSYHLAVVVDDAAQRITHVVRGADLLPSTAVHRLLQMLLGLPEPVYHHHALVLGPDGEKLSKSTGSTGLASLRAAGWTAADVAGAVGLDEPRR